MFQVLCVFLYLRCKRNLHFIYNLLWSIFKPTKVKLTVLTEQKVVLWWKVPGRPVAVSQLVKRGVQWFCALVDAGVLGRFFSLSHLNPTFNRSFILKARKISSKNFFFIKNTAEPQSSAFSLRWKSNKKPRRKHIESFFSLIGRRVHCVCCCSSSTR